MARALTTQLERDIQDHADEIHAATNDIIDLLYEREGLGPGLLRDYLAVIERHLDALKALCEREG
jgi:hypothetical protein